VNVPDDDQPDEATALLESALGDSDDAFLDVVWMDVVEIARAAGRLVEPEAEPE
jgi:hypothetical protein